MPRKKKKAKKKSGKRHQKPHKSIVVAATTRQKGRSKDPKRDRMWKALPPGKREGPSGVYYEYRANRSDVDPELIKKLPKLKGKKKGKKSKGKKKKRGKSKKK